MGVYDEIVPWRAASRENGTVVDGLVGGFILLNEGVPPERDRRLFDNCAILRFFGEPRECEMGVVVGGMETEREELNFNDEVTGSVLGVVRRVNLETFVGVPSRFLARLDGSSMADGSRFSESSSSVKRSEAKRRLEGALEGVGFNEAFAAKTGWG